MDLSHEKLSKLSTRTDFPKELSGVVSEKQSITRTIVSERCITHDTSSSKREIDVAIVS